MHEYLHTATIEKKIIELGLYCLAAYGKNTCAVITDTDTDTNSVLVRGASWRLCWGPCCACLPGASAAVSFWG